MLYLAHRVFTLLLGIGVLLVGGGLLGTALGMRANLAGFPELVIGAVMAAYFAGFIVGTFVAPPIIRQVGHVRAFSAFAAIASTSGVLHAIWVDPWFWAVLRMLTGATLVGIYMVVESWLSEQSTRETRGRIFAIYMMTTLVALAMGQFLLTIGDVESFVPFAVATMLFSLGLVPIALTRMREPEPVEMPSLGIPHLFRVSPLSVAGAFFSGIAYAAFWGMGPVYASGIGLGQFGVAAFMAATILGGALLQIPIGHLSDAFDRRTIMAWAALGAAGLSALTGLAGWVGLHPLIAVAFVHGGVLFTLYGLSVAHMNDHLEPGAVLEATKALLLVHGGGAVLGPLLAGLSMGLLGPHALQAFLALVLMLLGGYAFHRKQVSPDIPEAEQGDYIPMVRTTQMAAELDPRHQESFYADDEGAQEAGADADEADRV
ncbi:MAG: MFS transporter [Pseudomonadota bacterium]